MGIDRQGWRSRAQMAAATAVAVGALAGSAEAQGRPCQPAVTRVPFTIASPGVYCLVHDLASAATTGAAVTIVADNVFLDLRGYTLDGSGAGTGTQAIGISSFGRSGVTVTNGTIKGFHTGIEIASAPGTRGNVVRGVRADRNTSVGISVGGTGAVIRDNLVVETGGSTLLPNPRAYGISAYGAPGALVANNDVVDTKNDDAASYEYGIWVGNSDDVVVEGNRVRNPVPSAAYAFGILLSFSKNGQVVDNRISGASEGLVYVSGSSGKFRGNLTDNVGLAFTGGTDAGGNN